MNGYGSVIAISTALLMGVAQAAPPEEADSQVRQGQARARQHHTTEIRALLAFYDPIVKDEALGGFNNQLRDDGTVYDAQSKHCVGTARFTVNYALASLLYGEAPHKDLAAHGVSFLMERQQDPEHGGFAWVLNGHEVEDGEKWCCEHLFPPSRCGHPPLPPSAPSPLNPPL